MDNKKTYTLIIMAVLAMVSIGAYLFIAQSQLGNDKKKSTNVSADEKKFKSEYEDLNGKKREGKDTIHKSMSVDAQNLMQYASEEEILSLLTSGTGIIYFGFPECPWCRSAVPVLIETAKEENVKQIYYYNAEKERDTKEIKDGKVVTTKEGTAFYQNVLQKLGDKASVYEGLNDSSIKRLYFPTVVFVKNGKVEMIHESTVDSQKDPLVTLTNKQKTELKDAYIKGITAIYGEICDEKC